jgi:hypothetical protein
MSVPQVDTKKVLDERFTTFVRTHELPQATAQQLKEVLSTCKIVMLCDDSSSMNQAIAEEGTDPFSVKRSTRWLELKKLAAALIEIITAVNQDGLDLYFLNRPPVFGVTSVSGLGPTFAAAPNGGTPLIGSLRKVFQAVSVVPESQNVLVIVVGDGEQSDGSRDDLFRVLCSKKRNVHVSFAECTDQEEDMAYLDAWDGRIPNFDNTDDYREELARVKAVQGPQFRFTYVHYTIKILLATFVRWYFNLDQRKVDASGAGGWGWGQSAQPAAYGGGSGWSPGYSAGYDASQPYYRMGPQGQPQQQDSCCCIIL